MWLHSTLHSMADDCIARTLSLQNGIVFAERAIVHRGVYRGRNILAPNDSFTVDKTDDRGYLAVEWWIMSITPAVNPVPRDGEGITQLILTDMAIWPTGCNHCNNRTRQITLILSSACEIVRESSNDPRFLLSEHPPTLDSCRLRQVPP